MRLILIWLLFFCYSASNFAADTINRDIQKAIDDFRIKNNIPGMQLSVSLPNETTSRDFVSGMTEKNGIIPINTATLFPVGSVTKAFTATLIMQAVQQKQLSLDDKLNVWISNYPEWANVTIKQLLNMTSGIYDYNADSQFEILKRNYPDKIWSKSDLVNYAYQIHPQLLYTPGSSWNYSNTNYILLGIILEKIQQHSFDYIINHTLLGENYNLSDTLYFSENIPASAKYYLSHGYGENCTAPHIDPFCGYDGYGNNLSWAQSAGGIMGSAHDMIIWVRKLFGNAILPQDYFAMMQQVVCMDSSACQLGEPLPESSPALGFGFGLLRSGARTSEEGNIWWYLGSGDAYDTVWMLFPKRNIVISMAVNVDNESLNRAYLQLVNQIYQMIKEK